jgi:quercetin dioxygenase-like cupin family protein
MDLDHEPPQVLRAADSLYEPPDAVHSTSAKASQDQPASLIAFFVPADGEPSTLVELDASV